MTLTLTDGMHRDENETIPNPTSNCTSIGGLNANKIDTCPHSSSLCRPATVATTSVNQNRPFRKLQSRSRNTTAKLSTLYGGQVDGDVNNERDNAASIFQGAARPHTAAGPPSIPNNAEKGSRLFGQTNGADIESAPATIEALSHSVDIQRRSEILKNGVCARCNNLPAFSEDCKNGNVEASVAQAPTGTSSCSENTNNCDLEFVNTHYTYDEAKSVAAFHGSPLDPEDGQEEGVICEDGQEVPAQSSSTLQRLIEMGHKIIDSSIAKVGSRAAKVGEQIYKTGVGVASAFFSEQDGIRDDNITYNGFKIHTLGTHLCINSVILRGPKHQKMRIVVQTKDYEGIKPINPGSKTKFKSEPKIYIADGKWNLIYGSYEEEGTGVVEIQVPPAISLRDIQTEGPCEGLIFIDIY